MTRIRASLCALAVASASAALCAAAFAGEPWLYQLQNPVPSEIAASGFTRAVIDYSRDGSDATAHTPAEIAALKAAGVTPVCYFSIGEAEEYRFYFRPEWKNPATRPDWLGRENPEWEGNFKVRYWDPGWKVAVLEPYLAKIVAQGFSGVYLDIVDGFEYWGNKSESRKESRLPGDPVDEADAAARMMALIAWIRAYAAELGATNFLVIPQNGERLLEFAGRDAFLASVDGFGVESLWFRGTRRRPARDTDHRLDLLRQAREAGKGVAVVEYIDNGRGLRGANARRITTFLRLAEPEDFDYYVARKDQELDRINAISTVQP